MASGLAVIATDVGAVKLLVDQKNGILLQSPDPARIALAIEEILNFGDDELLAKKEISLQRISDFSLNVSK